MVNPGPTITLSPLPWYDIITLPLNHAESIVSNFGNRPLLLLPLPHPRILTMVSIKSRADITVAATSARVETGVVVAAETGGAVVATAEMDGAAEAAPEVEAAAWPIVAPVAPRSPNRIVGTPLTGNHYWNHFASVRGDCCTCFLTPFFQQ